jgi:hypothetical protein
VSGRNNWEDTHIAQDAERYYYRVVAQQQDQAQSVISNSVVISLSNDSSNDNNNNNNNDITTLRAPRLSGRGTVDGDYAEITLSWSKQQGKKRYVYYIYRSEASGFRPDSSNQVALDETITSHSWVDTDVEPNRSYFYKIVAVDMETNESSPASNQVHVNVK